MIRRLSRAASTGVILVFHRVESRSSFRTTIETVGRMFRFVSLAEVVSHIAAGKPLSGGCHVTFDDGDRSFLDVAVPVLESLAVPSSLYVSPRLIREERNYWFQDLDDLLRRGAEPAVRTACARVLSRDAKSLERFSVYNLCKCMPIRTIECVLETARATTGLEASRHYNITLQELLELRGSGLVTIGAHTDSHPVLARESEEQAAAEIRDSTAELATLLGGPVLAFAYPNGIPGLDFGPREKALLRGSGVRVAFSTRSGVVRRGTDPLAVPRVGFRGSKQETPAWVVGRLLLAPLWDRLRERLAGDTEIEQRLALQALLGRARADSRNNRAGR